MRQTPLAQLIETKIGRPLAEYVADARNAGKDWRTIARDIQAETGVRVSWETLRSWCTDAFVLVPRSQVGADTPRATA
jgi:hypothetical protein